LFFDISHVRIFEKLALKLYLGLVQFHYILIKIAQITASLSPLLTMVAGARENRPTGYRIDVQGVPAKGALLCARKICKRQANHLGGGSSGCAYAKHASARQPKLLL
jgi:hypothetical protein